MLPKQVQGLEPSKQVVLQSKCSEVSILLPFAHLTFWPITTCKQLENWRILLWIYIYSIQPYSSIPLDWKDANLLVCTQDLMGSFSCSDAWKQLHCWDKHGVSNVLCVLAPPNTCKSGGVAWVALCLAGLGQINMKSGRVGDKCLESGKGPGWKCTCKYLQPKNFLHKVSNFFESTVDRKQRLSSHFSQKPQNRG